MKTIIPIRVLQKSQKGAIDDMRAQTVIEV